MALTTRVLALALMALPLLACAEGRTAEEERTGQVHSAMRPFRLAVAFNGQVCREPVVGVAEGAGSARFFVAERGGRIWMFDERQPERVPVLVLDLRREIGERRFDDGILGLCFDPRFGQNRTFFVHVAPAGSRSSYVVRYRRSDAGWGTAPQRLETVITFQYPYHTHKAGPLAFGPDGRLYIGTGDGGGVGDPLGHAQHRTSLLGKVLRLDVDMASARGAYGSPLDNPFIGDPRGFREEIFALGLQNPRHLSVDPLGGRLWSVDQGRLGAQEVNVVKGGANYGWHLKAGTPEGPHEQPAFSYGDDWGQGILGGYVYHGERLPDLRGAYVFADEFTGRVAALRESPTRVFKEQVLLEADRRLVGLGLGGSREIYFFGQDGRMYRLDT